MRPPAGQGFNFSELFIRRPVLTTMMVLLLFVLGIIGGRNLPMDLFPNVEFPIVVVRTAYPGAAPQEIESLVTKPVEGAIAGAGGLDKLFSYSYEGVSFVVAQFRIEINAKMATADVRGKIAAIRGKLPKDALEPSIDVFDPQSQPIMNFALQGLDPTRLTTLLDQVIRPRLESISGVAAVQLFGDRKREIHIDLAPDRLAHYQVSLLTVFGALSQENFDLPAGKLVQGDRDLTLRAMGKFRSVEDLARMEVPTPLGWHAQLRDLGQVTDTIQEPGTSAFVNGEPAVVFNVIKQNGANSVQVGNAVKARLEEIVPLLPTSVRVVNTRDSTEFTKESNFSVWEHMAIGGGLAVAVLLVFLRSAAATFIGGLAIPLSIVATLYFMDLAGFSFNLLTNLALSMVVGILVDDAVVDLENIYRHMERGKERIQAAIDATAEVQLAVTATTLTIVAVFVPVAFMTGMIGKFFRQFGLTVAFAVLVSLLIARTVTPMLGARMLKVKARVGAGEDTGFFLAPRYRTLLQWALGHRKTVVMLAVLAFAGGIGLVPFIPKGFMTQADREEFSLKIKLPKGSTLEATTKAARQVEAIVRKQPEVHGILTQVGSQNAVDEAQIYATLSDRGHRKRNDREVAQAARDEAQKLPGVRTETLILGMVGQGADPPVFIQFSSDDLDKLTRYSNALISYLKKRPQFTDVDSTLAQARPELRIAIDRSRAADLGVTPAGIAQTLRLATIGDTATTFTDGSFDYDVRVKADPAVRRDLAALEALTMPGHGRDPITVGAVTSISMAGGFSQIDRRDRTRVVSVLSNLRPGIALGDAMKVVREGVQSLNLPPEVRVEFEGQAADMKETFTGLLQALGLAIVFIYLILAVQFESFVHPFTIMASLPLSVVGAFLALWLSGTELGMMAMIGVIMLMGIVTKNAILIVDFTITLRQRGMERYEALMHAGPIRLRPILMTTAAMVMGMLPMAMRIGAGSEFRYPMAIVVIGGLITSTLLTLIVVPVFYTLLDDLAAWWRGKLGWQESVRVAALPIADAPLVRERDLSL